MPQIEDAPVAMQIKKPLFTINIPKISALPATGDKIDTVFFKNRYLAGGYVILEILNDLLFEGGWFILLTKIHVVHAWRLFRQTGQQSHLRNG